MNWLPYPDARHPNDQGTVAMAEIRAKNGYLGCCGILKTGDKFYLYAIGETGKSWTAPDNEFDTIEAAKAEAAATWRAP